ncbi:AarF/UbiB family protein [Stieleria sp. JC731]|uniref:ABC1 kinase family protein n=1 Tax=Pirellulaceae TaxID=2691357 RepID=UPI001E52015A|nr:AarF/UbiB family protein [Stieleria sp. JC731]MCC9602761.1 AarF/UbiB family protein [Stieleria sp. JC731]
MIQLLKEDGKQYAALTSLLLRHGLTDVARLMGLRHDQSSDSAAACESAEQLASDIEKLGCAYVKLAQIVSTRDDIVPREYIEAFARLQDNVNPLPWDQIEELISSRFDAKPNQLFASIDERPLASASLGQVHRAKLRDGRDVVVKVRRPGITAEIEQQIRSLKRIAEFVDRETSVGKQFRFGALIKAVEYAFESEIDFRREADHLITLGENLADYPSICIPRPVPQLVAEDVLVMEYVSGVPIKDASGSVLIERNCEKIAQDLVNAYLKQILVDGVFHADPHPGNLMLLTSDGQEEQQSNSCEEHAEMALIDAGMVIELPPMMRRKLGSLLLAFGEQEGERAATIAQEIGHADEDFDAEKFRVEGARVVASSGGRFESMSVGHTLVRFLSIAGQNGLTMPFELILLSKAFLQLETTLYLLNPRFDIHQMIRARTATLLLNRAKEQAKPGRVAAALLESAELASHLPERVNRITRLLSENQLRVNVDAIDEAMLLSGVHKIANRITSGLIVASMIVGASIIMQLKTDWMLFGYPALATSMFLLSSIIGCILIYQANFSDRT